MKRKVKTQKPKRTKKVFRMWKFIACTNTMDQQHCKIKADAFQLGWPQKCEGKTLKELAKGETAHFIIADDWLVEEEY